MQDGYKLRDQSLPHFITATVVDWIDIFSRKNYRDCVVDCPALHSILKIYSRSATVSRPRSTISKNKLQRRETLHSIKN